MNNAEKELLTRLYQDNFVLMQNMCSKFLYDKSMAEDCSQDVFFS